MKKFLLRILSCTFFTVQTMQPADFTVASLNLQRFDTMYTSWLGGAKSGPPNRIVDPNWITLATNYLKHYSYDIVCFQELPSIDSQFSIFESALSTAYTFIKAKTAYGSLQLGLIYKQSKFKKIKDIPFQSFTSSDLNKAKIPNGFMGVILQRSDSTETTGIICTHFKGGPVNDTIREEMVQNIIDKINVEKHTDKWIICGDFNREYNLILNILQTKDSAKNWTIASPTNTATEYQGVPTRVIDGIFYTQNTINPPTSNGVTPQNITEWKSYTYPIVTTLPNPQPWFSDHAAIWATFQTQPTGGVAAQPVTPVGPTGPSPETSVFSLDTKDISPPLVDQKQKQFNVVAKDAYNPSLHSFETKFVVGATTPSPSTVTVKWDALKNTGTITIISKTGAAKEYILSLPGDNTLTIQGALTQTLSPNDSIADLIPREFPLKIGLATVSAMIQYAATQKPTEQVTTPPPAPHTPTSTDAPSNLIKLAESLHELNAPKAASAPHVQPLHEVSLRSSAHPGITIKLQIINIVNSNADAIVNAANAGCLRGGGIDGAITQASEGNGTTKEGAAIAAARAALPGAPNRCPEGQARVTISGLLKNNGIKYIIHATAPRCGDVTRKIIQSRLESVFRNLYSNILNTAHLVNSATPNDGLLQINDPAAKYTVPNKGKINSIAIPSMGTGIFACNFNDASTIAVQETVNFLNTHKLTDIKEVRFVFWEPGTVKGTGDEWLNCMSFVNTYESYLNRMGFN